uniref:Uncharacterized protein n=1 Tax=Heliothis virescens TaxID=7102 RepID=A0A2A4JK03_HELVI
MSSQKNKSVSSYNATEVKQPADEGHPWTNLRFILMEWAIIRLAVSILWTGMIIKGIVLVLTLMNKENVRFQIAPQYVIAQQFVDIAIQLVEIGMVGAFIMAGFKKSVTLYRLYYRYCIVTLSIYVVVVILVMVLGYDTGHYFAEIYLTYHTLDFSYIIGYPIKDYFHAFLYIALADMMLEVLLIFLVRKMVLRYEDNNGVITV